MSAEAASVKLEPELVRGAARALPVGLGSIKAEPEWREEALCVKHEPSYSETTGEVSDGNEAAVLAGVSEAAMLAGLYDDHVVKDELVLGPERPHRPCVGSTLQEESPVKQEPATVDETELLGSIKAEPEWGEEALCVKQEPSYSETTGEVWDGSEAAVLAGVSEAAMLAGLYDDHVVKDELVLGPERPHRPCVGSTLQEESPVKQEPATVDETELLDSERPVKSEVPEGAARAEDGPAREYCENEYIMQSSVLLRAESPVSLRARSQLAAACAVSRSSSDKHPKLQTQMSSTDNKPFHCSQCAYKASKKSDLQRHQRIHTGEKPLKCGYCEYRCSQKSSLQIHQRIHTGEKPLKCGYCEYRCSRKSDLQRHQRIHTGEKPFKCGYCDYKSGIKSNIQTHQKIHTGEKPFKCGYCEYRCSQKSSLQIHQGKHTGEQPFKCGYCDYKSGVKSHIQTHQIIHTGEKPFKCGYCEYKSGFKSNIRTHQKIHTREKPF